VFFGFSLWYTVTFDRRFEEVKNDRLLHSEEIAVFCNKPFVFL